jgi:FKBP12-rapamycin complex-associated protein
MFRSQNPSRKDASEKILNRIKEVHPNLVIQAQLVSDELIRSAIVLTEIWNEAIEEASRVCFESGNPCGSGGDPMGMVKIMMPFHKMMEKEPETHNEISFYQGYAADLEEACEWL